MGDLVIDKQATLASIKRDIDNVDKLNDDVKNCRLLVVGAGGIGCELLKNLVLCGFIHIDVFDLDTIELSNLNRQFLFQRKHVGQPKCEVARESVLQFNPNCQIKSYYESIMSPQYSAEFYKNFSMVLNALDNKAARNHVNRMCLAADVPLVESGSAGYRGQVNVIQKGKFECYECNPVTDRQKTYPGCTIRNTPSEPVHCIVWAKHLFNQLFGEADADEEVSPDTEDPEAAGDAGQTAAQRGPQNGNESSSNGLLIDRVSTRDWARESNYDANKIIKKLFTDDIQYLLSMDKLWTSRIPPQPLKPEDYEHVKARSLVLDERWLDTAVWSLAECVSVFKESLDILKGRTGHSAHLIWDKDDSASVDFTASASNIRSYIFSIPNKNKFQVKSIAGNIVPAIATTNAIISGLIVMEAFKILEGDLDRCKATYLTKKPNFKGKLLNPCDLQPPNLHCYVCSQKPRVTVRLNTTSFTVRSLRDKVLKQALSMVMPDVEVDDGRGSILISSEEGETEGNLDKPLASFNIINGTSLKADDFFQNYNLVITILHCDQVSEDREDERQFEITGKILKPEANGVDGDDKKTTGSPAADESDSDEISVLPVESSAASKRRYIEEGESSRGGGDRKRRRLEGEEEIIVMDSTG